jgi:hypothetical protein
MDKVQLECQIITTTTTTTATTTIMTTTIITILLSDLKYNILKTHFEDSPCLGPQGKRREEVHQASSDKPTIYQ